MQVNRALNRAAIGVSLQLLASMRRAEPGVVSARITGETQI